MTSREIKFESDAFGARQIRLATVGESVNELDYHYHRDPAAHIVQTVIAQPTHRAEASPIHEAIAAEFITDQQPKHRQAPELQVTPPATVISTLNAEQQARQNLQNILREGTDPQYPEEFWGKN